MSNNKFEQTIDDALAYMNLASNPNIDITGEKLTLKEFDGADLFFPNILPDREDLRIPKVLPIKMIPENIKVKVVINCEDIKYPIKLIRCQQASLK